MSIEMMPNTSWMRTFFFSRVASVVVQKQDTGSCEFHENPLRSAHTDMHAHSDLISLFDYFFLFFWNAVTPAVPNGAPGDKKQDVLLEGQILAGVIETVTVQPTL